MGVTVGDEEADDARLAELGTPPVVMAASAFVAVMGLFVALTGVQLLEVRWYRTALSFTPYVMLILGASAIAIAVRLYRMRGWAAKAALFVSGLVTLLMGGWVIFSFSQGLFSCMALMVVPAAVGATALSALSQKRCARATEIRRQLEDEGVHLGL